MGVIMAEQEQSSWQVATNMLVIGRTVAGTEVALIFIGK
jgi:hypothetical protein